MNIQKITEKLRSFSKFNLESVPVYPHRLFNNAFYDDSVRENMLETGSTWVVERIFALQLNEKALNYVQTQHWELRLWQDHSVFLVCKDAAGQTIYFEHRDPVKEPKADLSFVLENGVLRYV